MLFDRLGCKDAIIIDSYLRRYARNPYSDVFKIDASLKERLSAWGSAKQEYLYRMFDDNFILERKVEFKEPPALLAQKISKMMCFGKSMYTFYKEYRSWVNDLPFDYWTNEHSALHALVCSDCLSRESLGQYSGVAQYLPINIDFGDGKKIKMDANTKPMRALGKLVKMFNLNEKAFEDFRLEHSRILNTKSVTGTLCLSIHPLDYMTMSMNEESWTSCMNWGEPGGYRGGTIEVMNSPMTIVAYLKSDVNSITWYDSDNRWNSKKWRLLITVTPDAILSIKAYPYHHEELAREAIEWVRELAGANLNWYYGSTQKIPACSTFECPDTNEWYNIDFKEGRLMYCDWGCDTHYGCMTLNPETIGSSKEDPHILYIEYCGSTSCMCCGKIGQDYHDESYVICDECCSYGEEDGCSCDHCGEWIPDGEGYWVGDECYCCDCIDEVADRCAICSDYYYDADLERVYLAATSNNPNEDMDECILVHVDYCTGRWGAEIGDGYSNIPNPRKSEDGIYYFNREDLTADGLKWLYNLRGDAVEKYFENTD